MLKSLLNDRKVKKQVKESESEEEESDDDSSDSSDKESDEDDNNKAKNDDADNDSMNCMKVTDDKSTNNGGKTSPKSQGMLSPGGRNLLNLTFDGRGGISDEEANSWEDDMSDTDDS